MNEEKLSFVLSQIVEAIEDHKVILLSLHADVKRLKDEREEDMRANRLAVSLGELPRNTTSYRSGANFLPIARRP